MNHQSPAYLQNRQRLKQIQKSNQHVNNLVESAKRMIYNQKQLSHSQKQMLEVKISIEKDHLKNSFFKINSNDPNVSIQIKEYGQRPDSYENNNRQKFYQPVQNEKPEWFLNKFPVGPSRRDGVYNEQQSISKINTADTKINQKDLRAKIVISRDMESPQRSRYEISLPQNNTNTEYKLSYESSSMKKQTYQLLPQRNSHMINSGKCEPQQRFQENQPLRQQYQRPLYPQSKTPTMFGSRKAVQNYMKTQKSFAPTYKEHISITTPNKQIIIETQQQKVDRTPNKYENTDKKTFPKTENFKQSRLLHSVQQEQRPTQLQIKIVSEKSTSYKEILSKNKEKLTERSSKNGNVSFEPNPRYQLHIEQLKRKKQDQKERLYGTTSRSRLKQQADEINFSRTQPYSIANSRKIDEPSTQSRKDTSRYSNKEKDLSFSARSQKSLSSSRRKPLHPTTLKSHHLPFATDCDKCKSNCINKHHKCQEELSSYRLAKKYLTAEGQQECYNFLRSQGIDEKDWPVFITEYVYRQLSKAYQEVVPAQNVGN